MSIFSTVRTFQNDKKGKSLPESQYWFYQTGTETPKLVYEDAALTSPLPNPVVSDGSGIFPTIYMSDDSPYRVVFQIPDKPLAPTNYITSWTQDEVSGGLDATTGILSIASVANLFGLTGVALQQISLLSWNAGTDYGGGLLYWDENGLKSDHDGGMVFSPTVPFTTNDAYLDGDGETDPSGTGVWKRPTVTARYVTWWGAKPDGTTDATRAFNGSTEYTKPYTAGGFSNISARKHDIIVPETIDSFLLDGTVYVRKGQHIKGLGVGPTRIVVAVESGPTTFLLGYGLIDGVPTLDSGGLPPSISYLATEGGHTDNPLIDSSDIAGASINNLFVTACPFAINGAGGDMNISSSTFDDTALCIKISGSRNSITDNVFFAANIAISIGDGSYDWIINDNIFSYSKFYDIHVTGSTGLVRNILIADNDFLENAQLVTKIGNIVIQSGDPKLRIRDCDFSNGYGWGIYQITTENIDCKVEGCTFDGSPTHPTYATTSTMKGVAIGNGSWEVSNCNFKRIREEIIAVTTTGTTNDEVVISKNILTTNPSVEPFVKLVTLGDKIRIFDNIATDATNDLLGLDFAAISTTPLIDMRRNQFFYEQVSGGRKYVTIPTINSQSFMISVTYNGATAGSALYRKTAIFTVDKGCAFVGAVSDYVLGTMISAASPGTIPGAVDIQFELDSVGAGSTLAYTVDRFRNVIVSIPDTNTGKFELKMID